MAGSPHIQMLKPLCQRMIMRAARNLSQNIPLPALNCHDRILRRNPRNDFNHNSPSVKCQRYLSRSRNLSRKKSRGGKDLDQSEGRQGAVHDLLEESHDSTEMQDQYDFGEEPRELPLPDIPSRKYTDPAEKSILLFPGQGSQFVGMGKNVLHYPNVQEMFEIAGDILKYDLLGFCLNGPKEVLDKTVHCQLAVFVTSLAAVEKLKNKDEMAIENCVAAAGFSVGEFAALVFSGALSFQEAIYLIKVRAEAMQKASDLVSSGMLSVVGSRKTHYADLCGEAISHCQLNGVENAICKIATYLFPNARVIAGHKEALEYIKENAKSLHLRLARPISVSGAFHTPLMTPAQAEFKTALEKVNFETPAIRVYSNVDGKEYVHPENIHSQLLQQIVSPVHWEQIMHKIYSRREGESFPKTFEVGPGKQLGSILKQVNKKAFMIYEAVEV